MTVVLLSLLLATPALIFWLWLVVVPAGVAILCPEECWCDPGGHQIRCFGTSLTAVPLIRLTDVRVLWLSANNITVFKKDSLLSLTELEILIVRFCGLRTIELGTFNGLTNLRELNVLGNEISEILPGTFENVNSLERLILRNNRIENLDSDVFSGLVNLKVIYLDHNELYYIHPDTFLGLPNLQHLSLHDNRGLQIPTDSPFIKSLSLTNLDIPNCTVSSVSVETFASVSALELLNLETNRLENLDSDVFIGLFKLKYIYLSYNQLQYIHPDTFLRLPNLQLLSLYNNPGLQIPIDSHFIKSLSLTNLDISYCTVSSLSAETFASVRALEKLDLSYNRLEHLDSELFIGLVKLKNINLGANLLQYILPDTFSVLPNLQELYLFNNPGLQIPTDSPFIKSHSVSFLEISNCNVSSVSFETFANVSALEYLELYGNNLRTVDINILGALPKLSEFYLDGNPLQCDCQLQEVWRWCEDRNIQTVYGGRDWTHVPECDTPSEVEGMFWGVLEKAQCLEGNVSYHGDYKSARYRYTDIEENEYGNEYNVEFYKQYLVPVYAVPFVFGTISNVILLIIIICNRDMRTVPNMYIINLTISDIVYLTVLFSEACANSKIDTWIDGEIMCTFRQFCRRFSVCLSAYSVAVLSVQRYRVTVNPFQVLVSPQAKWCVTVATVCGVWIVAAIFALPSALSRYLCEELFPSRSITYHELVVIFELLVSCVIPLCIVAFSYIITALHLLKSSLSISDGRHIPQQQTRRNTAKIVVGLTVVFVMSYVPYHAFWTYFIFTKREVKFSEDFNDILSNSKNELQFTYLISNYFLSINSCLNPVALFCTSSPFREHLKRYLTCHCKTNSPPNDIALRRRN